MIVEAVLFDMRDTLLNVRAAYQLSTNFLYSYVSDQGFNLYTDEFRNEWHRAIKKVVTREGSNPSIHSWDELFFAELCKRLGLIVSKDEINSVMDQYNDVFVRNSRVYFDANAVLEYLKDRSIRTGVVIDGQSDRERRILEEKFQPFDAVAISEEVELNKFTPHPLREALLQLGAEPSLVMSVGDRIDKDIVHANREGCISVQIKRADGRYNLSSGSTEAESPMFTISDLRELIPIIEGNG